MKQLIVIAKNRDIEVGAAIMIIVSARDALDEGFHVQAASRCAFSECPIMVVVKQLTRVGVIGMSRFVAFKKVEPAVPIIIEPNAGLRWMGRQEPCFFGYVSESAIPVVAQQGTGNTSLFVEPRSPLDPNIQPAIVIIVSLLDVQPPGQAQESCFRGAFCEMTVTVVMEITQLAIQIPGRNHNVYQSIIVEIIKNASSRQALQIQTQRAGHIGKSGKVVF